MPRYRILMFATVLLLVVAVGVLLLVTQAPRSTPGRPAPESTTSATPPGDGGELPES